MWGIGIYNKNGTSWDFTAKITVKISGCSPRKLGIFLGIYDLSNKNGDLSIKNGGIQWVIQWDIIDIHMFQ